MNVLLPARTPVDLYSATGIPVGTKIRVSNLTTNDVRLSVSQLGLSNDHIVMKPYEQACNNTGDTGAWASCTGEGGVNVSEVI